MRVILREPRKIVPLCIAALFFFTAFINIYPYAGKTLVYPIYREFKKQCFIISNRQFNVKSAGCFRIFYRDTSMEFVDIVQNNAQKSLDAIVRDFGYVPYEKINIIIYPDYREMANKIGLGAGNAAMGVYYGGIISILEPEKWIKGNYDAGDGEVFTREGPILHELTHYAIDYQTGGNVTVWFTEGVALYEEYRVNGVEWGADKWYEAYYSTEQMEKEFYSLDEIKAYKQSFLIVKYIAENYGADSIKKVINGLSAGKSLDNIFKSLFKTDMDTMFKKACQIKA